VAVLDARDQQQQQARPAGGKEEDTGQPAGEHALLVHLETASSHNRLPAGSLVGLSAGWRRL
jgi:hypothetical protein